MYSLRMVMPAEFGWESCSERIVADMEHLCDEIERLGLVFAETKFFGSTHNFPTMHAGALMACMSKLDFLSRCMDPSSTSQTARMVAFLDKYVAPDGERLMLRSGTALSTQAHPP